MSELQHTGVPDDDDAPSSPEELAKRAYIADRAELIIDALGDIGPELSRVNSNLSMWMFFDAKHGTDGVARMVENAVQTLAKVRERLDQFAAADRAVTAKHKAVSA